MNEQPSLRERLQFKGQLVSSLLIVISSIGIYSGVNSGEAWQTWLFMTGIALGMAVAAWIS
jgi:hypothetical protein